jgi:hypothetical protein
MTVVDMDDVRPERRDERLDVGSQVALGVAKALRTPCLCRQQVLDPQNGDAGQSDMVAPAGARAARATGPTSDAENLVPSARQLVREIMDMALDTAEGGGVGV